jgi:hypothetical protein
MTGHLRARRIQVLTAIVVMLWVAMLIASAAATHCVYAACVLFFPVFLFGLLELPWLQRAPLYMDAALLPVAPILNTLFQRPPPVLD